jgi:3-oxoacyl-[acyl-carrier protein] reductase
MTRTPPDYPESHQLLAGKSVLITAAAGVGIGLAAARRCAEEGARVFISDVHDRRLAEAAEALAEITGAPVPHRLCDVTNDTEVRALVADAEDRLGGIDVLINNAGLGGTCDLVDMQDDEWFRVIDVTLHSVFRMSRAVLPHMVERGRGVVINNASVLGWRAQAGQSHYAAAKAAVMAVTRCVAIEMADKGVRVNAVSPSFATHPFLVKSIPKDQLDALEAREAFGRGAEPWEVANVMVFLASDYSSYMTGEVVSVSSQHP